MGQRIIIIRNILTIDRIKEQSRRNYFDGINWDKKSKKMEWPKLNWGWRRIKRERGREWESPTQSLEWHLLANDSERGRRRRRSRGSTKEEEEASLASKRNLRWSLPFHLFVVIGQSVSFHSFLLVSGRQSVWFLRLIRKFRSFWRFGGKSAVFIGLGHQELLFFPPVFCIFGIMGLSPRKWKWVGDESSDF